MKTIKFFFIVFFLMIFSFTYSQCWKSVSVGDSHALAIGGNNTLWAWGNNDRGQLGIGTKISNKAPAQVGSDSDWKIVSAGNAFTLALKNNGTLWAWGNNTYGQLGDGTFVYKLSPVQIGTDTDWKSISAGYTHALATKNNGTLWSWGNSEFYALGNTTGYGTNYHRNIPAQVGTLSTWKMVAAGDGYSLALQTNGTVYGWGDNSGDPLGLNSSYGLLVKSPQTRSYNNTGVKWISVGNSYSYDVKSSNSLLVTWGSDVYGETGGTTCAGCPVYYVKDTDCGADTAAIIKTDNTLWYTGKKLGYSASTVQSTKNFLQFGTASNWESVSVGKVSGAALTTNGELWTWGWNFDGNLGNGTTVNSMVPVAIACPSALNTTSNTYNPKCSIYPNPAAEEIQIITPENTSIEQLLVTDVSGKKCLNVTNTNNKVNISQLKSGLYLLHIQLATTTEILKFVKK